MSSDSDDDDELLQMALKEQAQRDLNYQGPSSNQRKPVVNFVQQPRQQPPPQRPSSTTNMANQPQQPKNRRAVEEEDDSEVEMLSISSGDEEVSKDRGGEGGAAERGRAGRGSGGREEESGWDGEEPDCWKRVDEAEVCTKLSSIFIDVCVHIYVL
jgi:exocyst complex component 2